MELIPENILTELKTNTDQSLGELSEKNKVLLIFLRHFGCIFCREALSEIGKKRAKIEKKGVKIVLVHMASNTLANEYFEKYGLTGILHVSDPECTFYQAFGLLKGNFKQLFGLQSWIRGFEIAVSKGIIFGQELGDGYQMPGVFNIYKGVIQEKYIHKLSSDKPNYEELALAGDPA
jgi:peroxiredoxin